LKFFLKYKTVLLRLVGVLILLFGFIIHFWTSPKEGVAEIEAAAANVARMEASVGGASGSAVKPKTPSSAKILEELKSTQEKQMRYLTIIAMVLGIGFLGYSLIKPKNSTQEESTSDFEQ
jgi:uncharacterized protein YjeT (DUF2065 family)